MADVISAESVAVVVERIVAGMRYVGAWCKQLLTRAGCRALQQLQRGHHVSQRVQVLRLSLLSYSHDDAVLCRRRRKQQYSPSPHH
jgi:hypothetical protein